MINYHCALLVSFLMIVSNVIFVPYSIFKFYFYCNGLPVENSNLYDHYSISNNFSSSSSSSSPDVNIKNQKILDDVKEAFKMFPNNGHLKKMIPKMFDINNPNPIYVFLLPSTNLSASNNQSSIKRITIKRNDFSTPIYPNVTATDIILDWLLRKITNNDHHRLSSNRRNKNSNINGNLEYEIYPRDLQHQHQTYRFIEENMILENIRTEKNFIDYVQELNAKEMILSPTENPLQYSSKLTHRETVKQNDWELLGLKGWEGSLIDPKKFNKHVSFSTATKLGRSSGQIENDLLNLNKLFSPIQMNSLEDNYEKLNKNGWDLPGKMLTDIDDDDNNEKPFTLKLNDTLLKMFNFDNKNNNNNDNDNSQLKKLKWPITSSRKNHRDSDIFIGRANDPFGHSTKWQTKNQTKQNSDERHKRAIVELYSMIKCSTGCDPLIFKGYGCYCGFSGSGRPMDGIDRCCRLHDSCYEKSICPSFLEYFVPYLWKCYHGKPLCAIEHGEWGNGVNSCAARLCQCDLLLAKCLQKYKCPKRRAICRTSKIRMLQNFLTIF